MDTVLFFVYSNKYICSDRIEGARRYAEKVGWNIQVVESNNTGDVLDMKGLVDFWKPIGVIAECGGILSRRRHRVRPRTPACARRWPRLRHGLPLPAFRISRSDAA